VKRPVTIVAISIASAGLAILFLFDPAQYTFYPICYFRALTGWNCPGCGATRAMHQLLHGHVVEAARANMLLVAALPLMAWNGVRRVKGWWVRQTVSLHVSPFWLWTILAIVAMFTVIRNLPGFRWLAS
jgi:hypothetical protein